MVAKDVQKVAESSAMEEDSWTPKEREVMLAAMETRLRRTILEVVRPTVSRCAMVQQEVGDLRTLVQSFDELILETKQIGAQNAEGLEKVMLLVDELKGKENERADFAVKWDEERMHVRQQFSDVHVAIQTGENGLQALQRDVDRLRDDLNVQDDRERSDMKRINQELQEQRHTASDNREDYLNKISSLERMFRAEIEASDLSAKKLESQLSGTISAIEKVSEAVKTIDNHTTKLADLDERLTSMTSGLEDTEKKVGAQEAGIEGAIDHMREEFRSVGNALTAHNASFINEIRAGYQEELSHAQKMRTDILGFAAETEKRMEELKKYMAGLSTQCEAVVKEVRFDVDDLVRKQKRQKTAHDSEFKEFKKAVGGSFDQTTAMLRGLEHLADVIGLMMETFRVSAVLHEASVDSRADEGTLLGLPDNFPENKPPDLKVMKRIPFAPSAVEYRGNSHSMEELMDLQQGFIDRAEKALRAGPRDSLQSSSNGGKLGAGGGGRGRGSEQNLSRASGGGFGFGGGSSVNLETPTGVDPRYIPQKQQYPKDIGSVFGPGSNGGQRPGSQGQPGAGGQIPQLPQLGRRGGGRGKVPASGSLTAR